MSRITRGCTTACLLGVYVVLFLGYRWRMDRTAESRPHGVPAWDFLYPTETVTDRMAYWVFYPCIRIDLAIRAKGEASGI